MKKITMKILRGSIIIGAILLFASRCSNLHAQQSTDNDKSHVNVNDCNEKQAREILKQDGLSDPAIEKWIMQRKSRSLNEKNTKTQIQPSPQPPIIYANSCGDMGVENGWSSWQGRAGTIANSGAVTWGPWSNPPPASNGNTAFTLTSGTANDVCTPSAGNPALPIVAPGFGNASIMLGVPVTPNAFCEQISFPFNVTMADTNFIYTYAIVLDNPADGNHVGIKAPHAEIYILDANGDTIPCSHQLYFGSNDNTIPAGMFLTDCQDGYTNAYKPWTIVGVNLNKYVGQTINVVVSNYDCSLGGHFCQSYWDFLCPPLAGSSTPFCMGQSTTLCAPASSLLSNQYSYQWYINTKPPHAPNDNWTIIPGATAECVTVTPASGDTFAVHIIQPSNCNFWIPFIPQPTTIIPDFTFTGACGKMTFTDNSAVSPISTNNAVTGWNWQFPGGAPANSTSQNPGTITYPPGTYTVTLTATSTAGCQKTILHTFTIGGMPTAAFQPTTPCLGTSTSLTDGSIAPQGDPIKSWDWAMAGGMPTSATTSITSTIYSTAGTHSVTLIITTQSGCKDTIIQQVLVYHPPVALFNDRDSGCAPVCHSFTDLSQAVDGSIVDWAWSFPGGNPSTSTQTDPGPICYYTPGTYGGSVMVTTNYGCKNSLQLDNIIQVYSWPNADFCVAPDKAPATDPVFNFCNLCSSDVVQWMWDFGDGTTDNINPNPTHSYSAVATANDFYNYKICLTVQNQHGCWDTICKPIEIIPEFEFYIPNCFTPNSDNTNEFFFGKCRGVKDYNIWVFDRWGNQVWDCHYTGKNTDFDMPGSDGMSSTCKWDGIVVKGGMDLSGNSGQLAQEDVYVWKVRLTDIFDKKHNYIGHVSIVK